MISVSLPLEDWQAIRRVLSLQSAGARLSQTRELGTPEGVADGVYAERLENLAGEILAQTTAAVTV